MRLWPTGLIVAVWVLAFAYALSFVFVVRDTNFLYIDGGHGKPDIGYYFSSDPDVNAVCHIVYWPLSRLLELTGRWVYLPEDPFDREG